MKTISKAGADMAKGGRRSFGSSSFHERFLRSYSYVQDHQSGAAAGGDGDLSELGEEEVWSMPEHDHHRGSEVRMDEYEVGARSSFPGGRPAWAADCGGQVGGLSLAFEDTGGSPRVIHQRRGHDGGKTSAPAAGSRMAGSAPVNVPNWPRMMRVESTESLLEEYDSAEEADGGYRIPPHEYLSRSRRPAATSVFEGVGRTLKGRDMSRVRDAVWSQTGFFGWTGY